jgi:hypothetical protein
MRGKMALLIGFGAGYVLGAKAGRQRYEQIQACWSRLSGSPTVQHAAEKARHVAEDGAKRSLYAVQHRMEKVGSAVADRLHRSEPTDEIVDRLEHQSGSPPEDTAATLRQAVSTEGEN